MKGFMKKFLTVFVLIFTLLFNLLVFTACNTSEDQQSDNAPIFSSVYSFDENVHWREEIGGTNKTDIGSHENDGGKCKYCDFYYDSTDWLVFEKINVYGISGYGVSEYLGDYVGAYTHIEIPSTYQGDEDDEPIPVIALVGDLFSIVEHTNYKALDSIKLNEGLKFIGNGAFEGTNIRKVVIPDSVIGGSLTADYSRWPSHGGLYNVFSGCTYLSEIDTGAGLKVIGHYTFAYCDALKEIKLGSGLRAILQRAFYETYNYTEIILPSTVVSIPAGYYYDRTMPEYDNGLERWLTETTVFPFAKNVYLNVTKDEFISIRPKDAVLDSDGNAINPEGYVEGQVGYVEGWCGMADIYYKGEWHYDEYGKPVAN